MRSKGSKTQGRPRTESRPLNPNQNRRLAHYNSRIVEDRILILIILLNKITDAQNEVALKYHRVRGLYFLAVIFAVNIVGRLSVWLPI